MNAEDVQAMFPGSEVVAEASQVDAPSLQAQAKAIAEWNEWVSVITEDRKLKAEARAAKQSSRKAPAEGWTI